MAMSIDELKERASYYFTNNNDSYWGSKIESPPDEHNMFIESIDNFQKTQRIYLVKFINIITNKISSLHDMADTELHSLEEAEAYRNIIANRIKNMTDIINMKSKCSNTETNTLLIEYSDGSANTIEIPTTISN